jgi:hypothetical protein
MEYYKNGGGVKFDFSVDPNNQFLIKWNTNVLAIHYWYIVVIMRIISYALFLISVDCVEIGVNILSRSKK